METVYHPNYAAHVGVAQGVGRLIRADIDKTRAQMALPLVVQRPHAVDVGQGRDYDEDLVFGGHSNNRRAAGMGGSLTPPTCALALLVTASEAPR